MILKRENPDLALSQKSSFPAMHFAKVGLICARILMVHLTVFATGSVSLARQPTEICDHAAQVAARTTGVPLQVLLAITRIETGRGTNGTLEPWPWTVNMEGKGLWFDTEDKARTYVFRHFKRGARSFDVGCFQINYKWHGTAFRSIDEMFDPIANAKYAARFLLGLYSDFGNWSDAAGAYHSRTPKFANRYKARFDKARVRLTSSQPAASPMVASAVSNQRRKNARVNTFPLLQAGEGTSVRGSLMQLGQPGAGRPLFRRQLVKIGNK